MDKDETGDVILFPSPDHGTKPADPADLEDLAAVLEEVAEEIARQQNRVRRVHRGIVGTLGETTQLIANDLRALAQLQPTLPE